MADKELISYLKRGIAKGHDFASLKSKLLGSGWNEKEINEAKKMLDSDESLENKEQEPLQSEKKKGFKWIKIAAIIGIIFFALQLLALGFYFISTGASPQETVRTTTNLETTPFLTIIIGILVIIIFELYFFGIVKMGKKTESKLIKFSGIAFMLAPLIFFILGIFSYKMLTNSLTSSTNTGVTGTISFGNIQGFLNMAYILGIVWIIIFAIYITIQILFSIGLIRNREKVKFSLISGIFHLILTAGWAIEVSLFAYLIIKIKNMPLDQLLGNLMYGGGTLISSLSAINTISYVVMLVVPLATLFVSLALFDASKKFE